MDSAISYNDGEHIESHLSKTQTLEQAYQDIIRSTDLLNKDEGARRLRLRVLMLETENDELHEQLGLEKDSVDLLDEETEDLRNQLTSANDEIIRHESVIKSQVRELSNLKAELESMHGVTSNSAKILTEKLSLSRELSSLKPELEHLRSQAAFQQTILGEKLALERQVSTLEVELEAEKRAAKRSAKKNNSKERELELQSQLDELQKELSKEKRDNAKALMDLETEFQGRFDQVQKELAKERRDRKKSRDGAEINAQSELEDLQSELARVKREAERFRSETEVERENQIQSHAQEIENLKKTHSKKRAEITSRFTEQVESLKQELAKQESLNARKEDPQPRKRIVSEIDMAIGTPDGGIVRKRKKARPEQTEKSTFSITPFLNRTMSIAPDSPDSPPKPIVRPVLTNSKGNARAKKPTPKSRAVSGLEQVAEEEVESQQVQPVVVEKKPRKRKLGEGKTLFDDDDGEATKRPAKAMLGAPRLLAKGGPKRGLNGSLSASGFGDFSPLKKDRRGVGASFLG